MKKLITLLVCLLPFSAFAEEEKKSFFGADLDVSIGVSSDYIFRGYNQNGGHLAVSGGAEASGRVGVVEVFGGAWASQVDYDDDTTYEYDLYGGGSIAITDNIYIEGIFTRYAYDGTVLSDVDEVEGARRAAQQRQPVPIRLLTRHLGVPDRAEALPAALRVVQAGRALPQT